MQIVKGRFFYPIRPFKNLREMILQSGQIYSQLDAFRFRDDSSADPRSKTYQAFIDDFNALGTVLLHLGFSGKRISVIGENSYNWSVTHTAVLNGVGVSVPLDRLLPEKEIITLLERGGVSAVFYDTSFHEIILKAVQQLLG